MEIVPAANPDMCGGTYSADMDADPDIGASRARSNWNRKSTTDRDAQRQQNSCTGHFCSVFFREFTARPTPFHSCRLSKTAHEQKHRRAMNLQRSQSRSRTLRLSSRSRLRRLRLCRRTRASSALPRPRAHIFLRVALVGARLVFFLSGAWGFSGIVTIRFIAALSVARDCRLAVAYR